MNSDQIHDAVRDYYRRAAEGGKDRDVDTVDDERWGTSLYDTESLQDVPQAAADLSMGCGNPYVLADLENGDVVLDLGSGGGIDVILSARRVAPDGKAYGIDMLPEMVALATENASEAGVDNVEFLEGLMEAVPLEAGSVDVVISNCVISLVPDKSQVFAEMARVLRPGGRLAISDTVTRDDAKVAASTFDDDSQGWLECGTGSLRVSAYQALLERAGFVDISIELTHEVGQGRNAAMIRGKRL